MTFRVEWHQNISEQKLNWYLWKINRLPTDLALIKDDRFRKYVELYAQDEKRFFDDFAKAAARLFELGVPFKETDRTMHFKKL